MVYIIIWAILSTGDAYYVNPTYENTIVQEEKYLAHALDTISKKAYKVDIKVYKAYPCEVTLGYKEHKKEISEQEPFIKSIIDNSNEVEG